MSANIVESWSSANTLRLEIGSPGLKLTKPIFHDRRGARILSVHIGKFRVHFMKFETFEMQESNDMTLIQFHETDGRHSRRRAWRQDQTSETHSAHYGDANDAEVVVNEQFLHAIESAFGPETRFQPGFAATAFVDFLVEARKLERLDDVDPVPTKWHF
jgi:hypothetical protein